MLIHFTIRLIMNILTTKTSIKQKATLLTTQMVTAAMMTGLLLGAAHAAPSKDTAAQPNIDIQTVMVQRCATEATSAKITDAKSAQKLCACTIGAQANSLRLGEFWAIQSMAMNNKDPRNLPAFKRIQPQLDRCRLDIKFNTAPAAAAATPAAPDAPQAPVTTPEIK